MSGILGLCNIDGLAQGTKQIAARMLEAIAHRAPKQEIFEIADHTVFGIRRPEGMKESGASIEIDGDGTAVILDGEIYASPPEYSLEKAGFRDAEIILHLYRRYGDDFLTRIDGSYSIALWDGKLKKLLLARDRLGFKPLFYCLAKHTIVFASEIKAVLSSGLFQKSVDLRALNDFLSYGYVPNPATLFKGILQVKPGHLLTFCNGAANEKPYWQLQYKKREPAETESYYTERFLDLLEKAVERRLKRHPDCGAFLSGGLDTSGVVAVMRSLTQKPFMVFTAGFEEQQYNEIGDAEAVVRHLGLHHKTVTIGLRRDLPELLQKIVWHHDAPFSDTSAIPSYFAAKLAKEHVSTVLTGDFPDQLIGGSGHQLAALNRLHSDPLAYRLMRSRLFNRLAASLPLSAGGSSMGDRIKRMIYRESFPLEEQRIILNMPVPELLKRWLYAPELEEVNAAHDPLRLARNAYNTVKDQGLLNKLLYFDCLSYAPDDLMVKVERMTMAHGLQAISPFHDRELVEYIASIPEEMKIKKGSAKYVMKEALRPMLPEHTLKKKKKGFDMPIDEWLTKRFPDYVREVLLDSRTLSRGYFKSRQMTQMVERFLAMESDYASGSATAIISLMTLELWHRIFIDNQG